MRCNQNENHILILPLYLLPVTQTSMTPSPPQNSPSAPGQAEAHKPLSTYVVTMQWNYILGRIGWHLKEAQKSQWNDWNIFTFWADPESKLGPAQHSTLLQNNDEWVKKDQLSGSHRFISPEYLADAPSEFARLRERQFVALLFPSKVTLRTRVLINL